MTAAPVVSPALSFSPRVDDPCKLMICARAVRAWCRSGPRRLTKCQWSAPGRAHGD
jgi:hypothetical protein